MTIQMRPLDWEEFIKTTKPFMYFERLRPFGILSCGVTGRFEPHRFEELERFCRLNQQFHIISTLDTHDANYAVPDALAYRLAIGDTDPLICYLSPLKFKLC